MKKLLLAEPGAMGDGSAPEPPGGLWLRGEEDGRGDVKRHFVQDWGWENLEDWVLLPGRKQDIGNTRHCPCRRTSLPA